MESYLTEEDIDIIFEQAHVASLNATSGIRVDINGSKVHPRMYVAVCRIGVGHPEVASMPDAWEGSYEIAKGKAFSALSFSSDQNALTTRALGELTQPGDSLWNIGHSQHGIVEFPGGIPLYKNGFLVGAVGVSGDVVDVDEEVAQKASEGFEAPNIIRSDIVLNISY